MTNFPTPPCIIATHSPYPNHHQTNFHSYSTSNTSTNLNHSYHHPSYFHRSTPCVQHYSKPTASTHNCFSASGIYRTFIGACEDHGGSSFPRLNLTNPSSSTPCQFYRLGRDKAPWLGQTLHTSHVDQITKHEDIEKGIYIDDGLSFGPSTEERSTYVKEVLQHLEHNGYIISPKSQPEPTLSKEFIGKLYANCFIGNTEARAARLLMMTTIIVQAPYLSHTFLKKLMGSDVYAVCHHSSYACLGFLRYILAHGGYMKPDLKFRASMCAVAATALKAWTGQGFFWTTPPKVR